MPVILSPSGTRGAEMPSFLGPLMKAGMGLSHFVFNLMGDRMKVQGQPLVLLTTVGARTGEKRGALMGRFADPGHPDSWLVVGSNAGAARHPGWCHNLAKNPDQAWMTIEKRTTKVAPDSLHGDQWQEAWDRVVSLAPGYGQYLEKTDRHIPIIRLTPV
jgi:deazaflavin-dependent oxidoreductase (nitroreductase family)